MNCTDDTEFTEPSITPPPIAATASPTQVPLDQKPDIPYGLISQENLLTVVADLTAIQSYSGWRSAGSLGELEAHGYIHNKLKDYPFLQEIGMDIDVQSFPVFIAVEFWESRLHLTMDGKEVEVPASGLRGSCYDTTLARNFDSDGGFIE